MIDIFENYFNNRVVIPFEHYFWLRAYIPILIHNRIRYGVSPGGMVMHNRFVSVEEEKKETCKALGWKQFNNQIKSFKIDVVE